MSQHYRQSRFTKTIIAAIAASCILCSASACTDPLYGDNTAQIQSQTSEGINLNTHYSAELREAREQLSQNGNDFAASILKDGIIADSELAELNNRVVQCLSDLGYSKDSISMGELGEMSIHPPKGAQQEESASWGASMNQDIQACTERNGANAIWQLASAAQLNPNNDGKDARQTIIDCYIKQGIVGASYSIDDYERDSRNGTGPFDETQRADAGFQQKLEACE
ncbi:hypothetical protein [Bifidobacterium scaligerum]|uniref:Lipoprotein n=1 Tax=Bifidobacterium scaligerum TaxID=2052656 RepID=A0A2M9HSJ7_9BIFI|nr:hypothetical protein [Bifidobacterium scaligerum]PJM79791.1 hypothetical protein CUU80_01205 [Bifidobacterium scaligerum]